MIYKYLESICFKNLSDDYIFIINKNLNDFKKYYKCDKYVNGWGIKYLKQDLNLCKLVIDDDECLSYINYKKPKLCLQVIKTFNGGFQYINKQYIEALL